MGVVSMFSSGTHAGLHVTWHGMERMGVSSSSRWSRVRCLGVSPVVDVFAEMFSGEVFGVPLIYVVDRSTGEMFVPIDFHSVQWCVGGVLWV